ncbi:hypothetical protein ACFL2B_00645 [Patescibacteria group bacterium]
MFTNSHWLRGICPICSSPAGLVYPHKTVARCTSNHEHKSGLLTFSEIIEFKWNRTKRNGRCYQCWDGIVTLSIRLECTPNGHHAEIGIEELANYLTPDERKILLDRLAILHLQDVGVKVIE